MAADRAEIIQNQGPPNPSWDWEVFDSATIIASGRFNGPLAFIKRKIKLKHGDIPIEVS